MREITQCEVCTNSALRSVMRLGDHPLPDDLRPIGTEALSPSYPVEILWCDHCNTAHQRFQIEKTKLFPTTYHYRARQTQDVIDGMWQLVCDVDALFGVRGKKVLDIGCNDGSLLTMFKSIGAKTYGIEPTDAAFDAMAAGHSVSQAFLDRTEAMKFVSLNGYPDVITFTNVFAHIEHLSELIASVKILAGPNTALVIENHYLGSVVKRHQFDTFYHEHPRTYSLRSFISIAESLGMHVYHVSYPQRYGGNIRVIMEQGKHGGLNAGDEPNFGIDLVKLDLQVSEWKAKKRIELLDAYTKYGPLAAAAFPGRAAILMRLLGLPDELWKAVYEKPGSKKIGYYVPGTHVPIVSDQMCPVSDATEHTPLVNLAWHIPSEIEARWRAKGFPGRIIQIVDNTDFL